MNRFAILKGLLPSLKPENHVGIPAPRAPWCCDIEIYGQEYEGIITNTDPKTARIIFWTQMTSKQTKLVTIDGCRPLIGREIHFHYDHTVYYMLIKEVEFETVAENPNQTKITLNGTLR